MSSIKERAEQTIINLLSADTVLAAISPKPQLSSEKQDTNPRLVVTAKVDKEIAPTAGLFRIFATVDIFFNLPETGQSEVDLDAAAVRVETIITTLQAGGRIGLIRTGSTASVNGLTAKRTISFTLIGG